MSRASGALFGAICSIGCATWTARAPGNLPSAEESGARLFVVTIDRALDLDDCRSDGVGELRGRIIRAWSVPPGGLGFETVGYLRRTGDAPDEIAARLGWKRTLGDGPDTVRIQRPEIVSLQKYDSNAGRTAGVVVTSIFGLALVAASIAFLVFVSTFNPSCGRPLRVRGRQIITPLARRPAASGWSEPLALAPVPENVRRVLAEVWTLEARGEHAAVAAFSKTSLELIALGAPPDLVARAHRAAIQEVEHARLCFAVASAYGGVVVEPAALPEALAGDTPDLFRLARESLLDGCLREGLASEIASLGAERARDPEIARVLRVQAKEEAQHAAFSWAIVEWAISCGGEPMRRSLSSAVGEMEFPRCDDLPDHGRIGRAAVEPRFHAIRSGARERLSVMT